MNLSRLNRKRGLQFALQRRNWSKIGPKSSSRMNLNSSSTRVMVERTCGGVGGETLNPKCVQQTIKHGGGHFMVWGTFLVVSELSRISHRMKVADYVQLLENSLLPFLATSFSRRENFPTR